MATPATLTPVGYLQFENGGLYASDSGEFATQSSINQVTKLTVNSRLAVSSSLRAVRAQHVYWHTQQLRSRRGLRWAVQGVLFPGEGKRPTVSASYIRLLYGGTAPDIDIGTAKNSAILLVSTDLAGFHFDINGFVFEQAGAALRRAQFGQTISISHPIGERVTIASELWHFSQPLIRGNAVGNLWCVSYALQKNLVVGCRLQSRPHQHIHAVGGNSPGLPTYCPIGSGERAEDYIQLRTLRASSIYWGGG